MQVYVLEYMNDFVEVRHKIFRLADIAARGGPARRPCSKGHLDPRRKYLGVCVAVFSATQNLR